MRYLLSVLTLFMLGTGIPLNAVEGDRGLGLRQSEPTATLSFNPGTYRALIIGNNHYQDSHGKWKPLKTAVSDARAVNDLLKNRYGFTDITLLENATRRDVLKAFESLSRNVQPDDNVLVYYAGHGFMEADTQRGFWVPVDARGTDSTTFLRNSTIRDELTTIAGIARHTLLVSDSCFSGSLLRRGNRGLSISDANEQYYKKVSNKKSVQIMAAGGLEYVDDNYRSSNHSPFTYFFLNELKNNDRAMLTVSELSTNVEKAVANNVDQVPESGVLHGAGDELGEFIFINMDLLVNGVPVDKVKVNVNLKQGELTQPAPAPLPAKPVKQPAKEILPVPTL